MFNLKRKLLMPSHIIIKDGLACGDKITLLYDFDNNRMKFDLTSNGCKCCEKICDYLQENLNGCACENIVATCDYIKEKVNQAKYIESFGSIDETRIDCYVAPITILKECASECSFDNNNLSEKVDLYVDKMDCDACATRENVSWLYQKPRHVHGNYNISSNMRTALMKLGKLSLKNITYDWIKEVANNLGDDEFDFLEEYKLMPMVYHNLKKWDVLDPNDSRWRLLVYQYQRTVMAKNEIDKINQFISESKVEAYWVKGAYTKSLYDEPMMRNLTDFDLLVLTEEDAFLVIEWLLINDFKIFPDSFSLKKTSQNETNTYTGHLHFQKIINLQYRLIIDVNFTGFPMIRVASYVPKISDSKIALESIIVVALCHLFKHKEVFIKDINDLYVMLTRNDYSVEILKEEINKNGLDDLFSVVLKFIRQDYYIPNNSNLILALFDEYALRIDSIDLKEWPYDVGDVNRIKSELFEKFSKRKVDRKRIYLYPAVIYKGKISKDKILEGISQLYKNGRNYKANRITDLMYQISIDKIYFLITPIGFFLEMKEYYIESMKSVIRKYLVELLNIFDVETVDIPYAIAFEEKWLDN